MEFNVATSADGHGSQGPARKRPPPNSIAGEVKRKTVDLSKVQAPPPLASSSVANRELDLHEWRARELGDVDEDLRPPTDYRRFRDINTPPIRGAPMKQQSTTSTIHDVGRLAPPNKETKRAQIQAFLEKHPQMKPYHKWRVNLEGKNIPSDVVHTPLLFNDTCSACGVHGDDCFVADSDRSLKCHACKMFGGRCIYLNVGKSLGGYYGNSIYSQESWYLNGHTDDDTCGRCRPMYPHYVSSPSRESDPSEIQSTATMTVEPYPTSLEYRLSPRPLSRGLGKSTSTDKSSSASESSSSTIPSGKSPAPDATSLESNDGEVENTDKSAPAPPDLPEKHERTFGEETQPKDTYETMLRDHVLRQSTKLLQDIQPTTHRNRVRAEDVGRTGTAMGDPTTFQQDESIPYASETNEYWEERLKRELRLQNGCFWDSHGHKHTK